MNRTMMKMFAIVFVMIFSVASASASEQNFILNTENEGISFVNVSVLLPDAPAASFEGITENNISENIFDINTLYVSPKTKELFYKLSLGDSDPKGKYTLRIISFDENQAVVSTEYMYYDYMSSSETSNMLEEISQSSDAKATIAKYSESYKLIVPINKINEIADFNTLFAKVKNELYTDGFDETQDVYDAISYVLVIKNYSDNSVTSIEKLLSESVLEEEKAEYQALDAAMKEYADSKYVSGKSADSIKSIKTDVSQCIALSIFKYGNYKERAEAMRKYSEAFGFDITKADNHGVSLERIGQQLSGDTVSEIKASFDSILNKLINGNDTNSEKKGGAVNKGQSFPTAVGNAPTDEQNENKTDYVFSDMIQAKWANEYVEHLYNKGIISGDGDGTFRPQSNITRAEFVKMVVVACGFTASGAEKDFEDSTKNDWYYPYVLAAYNNSIVKGKTDLWFGSNENITREDMAVILYRALKIEKNGELNFADGEEISEYARDAVQSLAKNRILSGFEDNTFRGKNYASRAEAAALISRLLSYKEGLYE